MNTITIVSESLWPTTSVGGSVLQLPLADVPSPKSIDQLAMSLSGSLLLVPRKLIVNGVKREPWVPGPALYRPRGSTVSDAEASLPSATVTLAAGPVRFGARTV